MERSECDRMSINKASKIYSTYASRPRRRPTSTVLLRAIAKVMSAELSSSAIRRWQTQLNELIGESVFKVHTGTAGSKHPNGSITSKAWCPQKPRTASLLLQALVANERLPDGRSVAFAAPVVLSPLKRAKIAKILCRRLVECVVSKHRDADGLGL